MVHVNTDQGGLHLGTFDYVARSSPARRRDRGARSRGRVHRPRARRRSSTAIGPSTTTAPYVLPVANDVRITSLLTVGDGAAGNGYQMVGIPDGLGFARERTASVVVYMNQELRDAQGIVRRHGQTGAFVSRYVIDQRTLKVKSGSDLIDPGVRLWDYPNGDLVTSGARFADLAPRTRHSGGSAWQRHRIRASSSTSDQALDTEARSISRTRRTATTAAPSAVTGTGAPSPTASSASFRGRTPSRPPTTDTTL